MKYSLIIPVYNRPDEVDELLESLCHQTHKDFEVLVIEDGSQNKCEEVVQRYLSSLDVRYFYKENSGPSPSRNYGAERSRGEFLLILDSDCARRANSVLHEIALSSRFTAMSSISLICFFA